MVKRQRLDDTVQSLREASYNEFILNGLLVESAFFACRKITPNPGQLVGTRFIASASCYHRWNLFLLLELITIAGTYYHRGNLFLSLEFLGKF